MIDKQQTSQSRKMRRTQRQGAMTALMAVLIPVLIVIGAMAINIAYMQLTRTELMVATDAATRAGGRAMSFYQNVDQAMMAAQTTGALNNVAGEALRISIEDSHNVVEFGDCGDAPNSDRYDFTKVNTAELRRGNVEANAMRINSTLNSVPLLFPTLSTVNNFDLQVQAVAMQVDRDIAMVLDRSGSMDWATYDWPNGFSPWSTSSLDAGVRAGYITKNSGRYYYAPGHNSTTYQDWVWEEHLNLGEPPNTPWESLTEAVDVFLQVLEETDQSELVSLATYSTSATLDLELQSDYDVVRAKLATKSPSGATAIGSGMLTGIPSLLGGNARPFAAKTIIVMTDGIHNRGTDPETAARSIVADHDVTIHTVTFGGGADISRMQAVAAIGGGTHFHAADGDELVEVFEEIANNLPTLVTK